MRIIAISLAVILKISSISFAQKQTESSRFSRVDTHVYEVNKQFIFHPELLTQKLTEGLTNDYDKVRAFYVWIARNIDYDLLAFIHKTKSGQSINQVIRSGKALCSGFSLLFEYFCEQENIEAVIIEGYAKGYGYKKNQQFHDTNHAWNAVKIYNKWYLLDATWATGSPTNLSKHQKKIDLDSYFLSDPDEFIKTHLPEDPSWQLLNSKISLTEFENGEYQNNNDWVFNTYSPKDYDLLNEYDTDVLKYKRAKEFSPANNQFNALLSFSYLYKGISMTDELWKMDFTQLIDTATFLKNQFNAYMDSATVIINSTKYTKYPYTIEVVADEINYQSGIINYELAVEIFTKAMNINIPLIQIDEITNHYFDAAELHFENVAKTSIYLKDSREYLNYIHDFRLRKAEQMSGD